MKNSVFIDRSFPNEPPTPKLPLFGAIDEVDNVPDFFVLKIGGYRLQLKRSVCFVYIYSRYKYRTGGLKHSVYLFPNKSLSSTFYLSILAAFELTYLFVLILSYFIEFISSVC